MIDLQCINSKTIFLIWKKHLYLKYKKMKTIIIKNDNP